MEFENDKAEEAWEEIVKEHEEEVVSMLELEDEDFRELVIDQVFYREEDVLDLILCECCQHEYLTRERVVLKEEVIRLNKELVNLVASLYK